MREHSVDSASPAKNYGHDTTEARVGRSDLQGFLAREQKLAPTSMDCHPPWERCHGFSPDDGRDGDDCR